MGNSGTPWIDAIFDWAVHALGTSYELVNIVVFLGIGPALVGFLIGWVVLLRRQQKETDDFIEEIWRCEEISNASRVAARELQKRRKASGNNA